MDINSPEFSDAFYKLLQKAQADISLKQQLLTQPKIVLADYGIEVLDYQVHIEENLGYGLYFEISHPKIVNNLRASNSDSQTEHETFMEQHYMDCHNV